MCSRFFIRFFFEKTILECSELLAQLYGIAARISVNRKLLVNF